jgi:hypothetical protein
VTLKEASVFSVADAEQLFPGFSERPIAGIYLKKFNRLNFYTLYFIGVTRC